MLRLRLADDRDRRLGLVDIDSRAGDQLSEMVVIARAELHLHNDLVAHGRAVENVNEEIPSHLLMRCLNQAPASWDHLGKSLTPLLSGEPGVEILDLLSDRLGRQLGHLGQERFGDHRAEAHRDRASLAGPAQQ
ncbi:MAG TPA: hypothetical protein VEK76_10800 [Candidatus Binatia bacterium]|nr:hypothetical protein [Candidatus Binatia bacterium]